MGRSIPLVCIVGMLLSACAGPDPSPLNTLAERSFATANGDSIRLGELLHGTATLFITMSPDCPMCLNYAGYFAELGTQEAPLAVGVLPTGFIPRDSAVAFARLHGITMPLLLDPDCELVKALGARVTPEVFLLDSLGRSVYQGAIDDWPVRAGRKKLKATRHYLKDALAAYASGEGGVVKDVTAVGCVLECD